MTEKIPENIKKNNPMQQKLLELNNLVNMPAGQVNKVTQTSNQKQTTQKPDPVQKPPSAPRPSHNPRGIDVPSGTQSPVSNFATNSPYANLIKKLNPK